MTTNADEVFEDLMSYNVFDLSQITDSTQNKIDDAVVNDPLGSIKGKSNLLKKIAGTDKAKAIAASNKFSSDVQEAKSYKEVRGLVDAAPDIEGKVDVGGEAEFFSAKTFEKARGDVFAKNIGIVRDIQAGREPAFEIKRVEFQREFREELDASTLRNRIGTRGKSVSSLADYYKVSEDEVRDRAVNLGLSIDDNDRVRI